MRPKKQSRLINASLLVEVASHAAMGIAVGLAFAFLVTHIASFGIAALSNYNPAPISTVSAFVGTCAATFGIGATLTGSLFR